MLSFTDQEPRSIGRAQRRAFASFTQQIYNVLTRHWHKCVVCAERRDGTYRRDPLGARQGCTAVTCILDEGLKPQDRMVESINLRPSDVDVGSRKMLLNGPAYAFR
jgi:hypothetical protein